MSNTQCQTVWISFRCTQADRIELRESAHTARLSVSELTRRRALGLPAPIAAVPQINVQVYADLSAVCNDLNQLTKLVHELGQPGSSRLNCELTRLEALLKQVRLEVIGAE